MASGDRTNKIAISFVPDRCLHARTAWATCSLCFDSCPGQAITKSENRGLPQIDPTRCMQCGQCLTACPLEAFDSRSFSERKLVDRIEPNGPVRLHCYLPYGQLSSLQEGTKSYQLGTCLASLSPGVLFELSLTRSCNLMTERCATCPLFQRLEPTFKANVSGAFRLLHGIGKAANLSESTPLFLPKLTLEKEEDGQHELHEGFRSDIRALFLRRNASPGARKRTASAQWKPPFRIDWKNPHVPYWRQHLNVLWDRYAYSSQGVCTYAWPQLVVDAQKCRGCGTCMQMCPTGTIRQSLENGSFVHASVPGTCTDCGLCMTVCPCEALSRDYRCFSHPFETVTNLKMPAKACSSCGKPALEHLGDKLCPHCSTLAARETLASKLRKQLHVTSYADQLEAGEQL